MRRLLGIRMVIFGCVLVLAAASAEAAVLRYRGKAWSAVVGGTNQNRIVLYPTADPTHWTGTFRCRPLSRRTRCLAPVAQVDLWFAASGEFEALLAGGLCEATGVGTPYSALSGQYSCENGDAGTFYFRRVR